MENNNQSKHTSGPWVVKQSSNKNNGSEWRDIVSNGQPFALSYVGEALKQDAQLISAAPKLLEACKAALNFLKPLDMEDGLTLKLLKAIEKAEGR